MAAGAIGGKLLGAGGSRFILVYCKNGKRGSVIKALAELVTIPFAIEESGSMVVQ